MDVRIVTVAPDFEVVAEPTTPAWSREQAREIDRLWSRAEHEGGARLPDETLLTLVQADERRLVGRFVRRRDVVAGELAPELFDGRPPTPVGVCALVTTRGRVVLGRRAEHLARWPGRWELVPSGALDPSFHDPRSGRVDLAAHVLAELVDHTPLPRPAREAVRPYALVHDRRERSWCVCTAIELDLAEEAVEQIEAARSSTHDAFRVVRPVDVLEAGLWDGEEMVPLAWTLVRMPRYQPRAA